MRLSYIFFPRCLDHSETMTVKGFEGDGESGYFLMRLLIVREVLVFLFSKACQDELLILMEI